MLAADDSRARKPPLASRHCAQRHGRHRHEQRLRTWHRPSAPPTAADIGTPAATASDAREARPPAVTLLAWILELIEQSHRPKHPWQIQKELNLPRMPSAELSKLTAQGFLVRLREGLYGVAGRDYQNWLQGQTMPTIHARHPAGFLITFEDVDRDR